MDRAKLPFKVELLAKKTGLSIVVAFGERVRQNALALGFNVPPSP